MPSYHKVNVLVYDYVYALYAKVQMGAMRRVTSIIHRFLTYSTCGILG